MGVPIVTYDDGFFKELDQPYLSKVSVGNGENVVLKTNDWLL